MTIRAWAFALLACAAAALAGCSEVDSCTEGETAGCLNSDPRRDGSCLYDLVLRGGKCVKQGGEADFCGFCADGSLCVPEQNRCVNFCESASPLPGTVAPPTAIFCEATADPSMPGTNPMLSFEEVCTRRCQLECQRRAQFCTDPAGAAYACAQGACERPEVLAQCAVDCPPNALGTRDLACLTRRCNDMRLARCDTRMCPTGFSARCENVSCTNDCSLAEGGGAADGICDDGDPASAETGLCSWGSDCTDCGPRRGAAPPSTLGSVCAFQANCAGATASPSTSEAWCIGLDGIPGLARCAPDCSRGQDCPDGFECIAARFESEQDPDGEQIVEMLNGKEVRSAACAPLLCYQ